LSVLACNRGAKPISVVALVSEQVFEGKTADQALCLTDISDLVCGKDEPDRDAVGVRGNADLRAQAVARTPDRLLFFTSALLAPAGC
jgi:hypothetical protein